MGQGQAWLVHPVCHCRRQYLGCSEAPALSGTGSEPNVRGLPAWARQFGDGPLLSPDRRKGMVMKENIHFFSQSIAAGKTVDLEKLGQRGRQASKLADLARPIL